MADLGQIEMSLGVHWIGQLTALGDDKVSFVVPYCYGAKGWSDFQPLAAMYPAALWNASGAAVDWEMLEMLRAKERYDWRTVVPFHNKEDAYHEPPWFCYLKGRKSQLPSADPPSCSLASLSADGAHPPRRERPPRQPHPLVAAAKSGDD